MSQARVESLDIKSQRDDMSAKKSEIDGSNRGIKDEQDGTKMFRVTYVVDSEEGPYKTIQSAIDDAKPNSTIKITSGLYKENIVIREPSLKIESKDFNPDVYIMGNKGPAVLIDIPNGGTCLIQNIRFVHKGGAPTKKAGNNGGMNAIALNIKGFQQLNELLLG